jgi:hypothetical protein
MSFRSMIRASRAFSGHSDLSGTEGLSTTPDQRRRPGSRKSVDFREPEIPRRSSLEIEPQAKTTFRFRRREAAKTPISPNPTMTIVEGSGTATVWSMIEKLAPSPLL